jgi:hypothetical protein
MAYHLTLLLPLTTQIKILMTGHHTIIAYNLRLPTSYSAEIKCLPEISTSYSASGLHLFTSTAVILPVNHRFRRLRICTTQLIQLLLVTSHGSHSAYSITEPDLKVMFRLGWKLNMTSGFGIHALWSTTSCLIPISRLVLITHHIKSEQVMDSIGFKTSCLGIGPGIKRCVFSILFYLKNINAHYARTLSLTILLPTARCFVLSFLVVTRLPSL